jgi:hypothetical protein
MMLAAGRNQAGLTDKQIEYGVEVLQGARFRGTHTKMPFVFPIRGQTAQDGVGPLGATGGKPREAGPTAGLTAV